jgi:hypothetical protein
VCSSPLTASGPLNWSSSSRIIALLITNTRLAVVDDPELMRRTREKRPGLPILQVIHGSDADGDIPPGMVTLWGAVPPNQLRLVVGSLLA